MIFPKVFFDANDGSFEQGYWLGFDRSRNDLEALGEALRDGTRVIIIMPDELQMEAFLRFDPGEAVWWGDPIEGTFIYLDGSA